MSVDKNNIREQIIEASRIIFNKFGFKKTTMDEIAQSMGKGKSSIYYYFKSKEEIYQAVIEYEAELLRNEVIKALSKVNNSADKLKAYVLTRMIAFRKVITFYHAIQTESEKHLTFIEKIRQKYDQKEIMLLQGILDEGVAKDDFRIKDTELAAFAIFTALKGLEIPMFWSNQRKNAESQLEGLLSVLFYGIMKK
jgi:AcrR family transcriptional regulator